MAEKNLYQRLLTQTKEAALKALAPALERKDRLKIKTAFNNKQIEIDTLKASLDELRANIKESGVDIKSIIQKKIEIKRAEEVRDAIAEEFETLFSKKLSIED